MIEEGNIDQSSRLAEIYSACFSLILHMRSSSHYSDAETLRDNLISLINECENTARRSASAQDVEDTKFALVAFVDETVLSSDWAMKGAWMANPLQLQIYNRFDAGEHFFERMDIILKSPSRSQVLEVYYLCLALGFKGRYQLVDQDQLRARIAAAHSALKQAPEMQPGPLSPNGKPRDQLAAEVKSKLPTWAMLAGAVTIGLVVYMIMSIFISNKASGVKENIEELSSSVLFEPSQQVAALTQYSGLIHASAV
jgi:type VI secretion system protein ImpK